MILKQFYKLNHFIAYTVLIFLFTLPLLRAVPGPGYLIPPGLALLIVYVFGLVPHFPRPGRKYGFYAGQGLIILANGLVILSIGLPVLWSSAANDSDLLLLLWLAIPALVVAMPCWLIGLPVAWFCGRRRAAPPLAEVSAAG